MHDGIPYGRNQGQGHSREVDRQSPTGLIFMRPSSLGGGRILRRTLSVCPSVCPSVRPVRGSSLPCGRVVSFVLFTFAGRI